MKIFSIGLVVATVFAPLFGETSGDRNKNLVVGEQQVTELKAFLPVSISSPTKIWWEQTAGPTVEIKNLSQLQSTFLSPSVPTNIPLVMAFDLCAQDESAKTTKETIYVVVMHANRSPVAIAGDDQMADVDGVVLLDGSSSHDPDKDDLIFLWTQTSGPAVQLSQPRESQTIFSVPPMGPDVVFPVRLVLSLAVFDPFGARDGKQVAVVVRNDFNTRLSAQNIAQSNQLPRTSMESQMRRMRSENREAALQRFAEEKIRLAKTAFSEKRELAAEGLIGMALTAYPMEAEGPELLKKIFEKQQKERELHINRGLDAFIQRDYLEAIRHFRKASNGNKSDLRAEYLIEVSVEALQQRANADFGTRLVEYVLAPQSNQQQERGQVSKTAIISKVTSTVSVSRDVNLGRQFYCQGLVLYSKGDLEGAHKLWRRAVGADNENELAVTALRRVKKEIEN